MSTREIGEVMREQIANLEAEAGAPSVGGGGGSGAGSGVAPQTGRTCRIPRSEAEFGPWFEEYYGPLPFSPADRAALRRSLWDNWETTEQIICASRGLM
jgi:hypothetical protein